jgi:hypothetical protein
MADLFGTDAADTLTATGPDGIVWGRGGDDTLTGLPGSHARVLVGGPGLDTAQYGLGRFGSLTVGGTPVAGVYVAEQTAVNAGTDILVGVENLRLLFSNDTLDRSVADLAGPAAPLPGGFWDAVARVANLNHAETGTWYVTEGPGPGAVQDWDALAAEAQANFAATGHWFV